MAWVSYNAEEHGVLSKNTFRLKTWKQLKALSTSSLSDTQVSLGGSRVNKSACTILGSKPITHDDMMILDDEAKLRLRNFDGWSTFIITAPMIEVLVDNSKAVCHHDDVDYTKSVYQACSNNTKIVLGDHVRVITVSSLVSDYNVKNRLDDLYVGSADTNIRHYNNSIAQHVSSSSWKKMRKGELVLDIDDKHKTVLMSGTYGDQYRIPFEFLEIKPKTNAVRVTEIPDDTKEPDSTELQPTSTQEPTTKSTKKDKNMEAKFNAQQIMDQNKDALLVAAKIQVGEAAVQQVSKILKKQLPMMVRGYAELPVFDILVANMVVMSIKQFAPENEKANVIADAMLLAAMQKQMREFNIPGMIDEFVSGIDVSAITKLELKDVA